MNTKDLISKYEGNESFVYGDGKKIATVGIGFNLAIDSELRPEIFALLGWTFFGGLDLGIRWVGSLLVVGNGCCFSLQGRRARPVLRSH